MRNSKYQCGKHYRTGSKISQNAGARYNENDVGMTKHGDTWTTHAEKAFGLHPPVAEGNIPWDEILKDLGLN
jgi:hypothetical protein